MNCRLFALLIPCLLLSACSENNSQEPENGSNSPLQFSATIGEMQTRANANHQNTIISSGETVWLWIDRNKDQSKYIGAWQHSSDGLGKLYPVPTITRFYPTGNATINIYGIHGYFSTYIGDDDTRPDTLYHSVFNDQSVDANYLRSDLLWTNDIKQYAGDDIKLIFSHMLSKIEVCFKPVGSLTDDSIAGAKAWLVDMQQQAKINPTTGVGATLGNAKDMPIPLKTLPYSFVNNVERAIFTKCNIEIKFSKVYIDFDDTIIINGAVVPLVISFIYEMKNQKKDIILITRHEFDLYKTLKRNALSKDIFSEIIHIKDKSPKSNYIKDKDSIFVDNHFLERQEVFEKCQIPVFDVDYLEFFIR